MASDRGPRHDIETEQPWIGVDMKLRATPVQRAAACRIALRRNRFERIRPI